MDEIQKLIERSRSEGGFRQKGFFSLDYAKAKTKIAEFALPSKDHYILELIQSAVSSGAVYVDIMADESSCTTTFAGVVLARTDLEILLNFILASEADPAMRARRRLAIGIASALTLPTPTFKGNTPKVVIESGDGTVEGSVRVELTDLESPAVIGTPLKPLHGTFVKVTRAGCEESSFIGSRCFNLPVPLCVNGEVMESFNRRTIWVKGWGIKHPVAFDEGDLWGGIAWSEDNSPAEMKILTNGVWICSITLDILPKGISGIVNYDRLNKTANQYSIVMDERVAELTERLKPLVDRILKARGWSDGKRLEQLFTRTPPRSAGLGEPYLVDFLGIRSISSVRLSIHREYSTVHPRMDMYLSWKGRIVDAAYMEFARPCLAFVDLASLGFDCLFLRQKTGQPFDPNYPIGVMPDVYGLVKHHIDTNMPAIVEHLGRSDQPPAPAAPDRTSSGAVAAPEIPAAPVQPHEAVLAKLGVMLVQDDPARGTVEPTVIVDGTSTPPGSASYVSLQELMRAQKTGRLEDVKERIEGKRKAKTEGLVEMVQQQREVAAEAEAGAVLQYHEAISMRMMVHDRPDFTTNVLPVILGQIVSEVLGLQYGPGEEKISKKKFVFAPRKSSDLVATSIEMQAPEAGSSPDRPEGSPAGFSGVKFQHLPTFYFNLEHPAVRAAIRKGQSRPQLVYLLGMAALHEMDRPPGCMSPKIFAFHDAVANTIISSQRGGAAPGVREGNP